MSRRGATHPSSFVASSASSPASSPVTEDSTWLSAAVSVIRERVKFRFFLLLLRLLLRMEWQKQDGKCFLPEIGRWSILQRAGAAFIFSSEEASLFRRLTKGLEWESSYENLRFHRTLLSVHPDWPLSTSDFVCANLCRESGGGSWSSPISGSGLWILLCFVHFALCSSCFSRILIHKCTERGLISSSRWAGV